MKKLALTMGLALAMTAGLPAIASANHGGPHYPMHQQPMAPPPMAYHNACRPACPPPVVCRPACDPCRRSGLLGLGILGIL